MLVIKDESIFMHMVLFQTIQFSIRTQVKYKISIIFQAIQFSMSTQSIWLIDRTLSGAAASGQSGPGSDGSEEVLPQNCCITGVSPSDYLESYPGHSL